MNTNMNTELDTTREHIVSKLSGKKAATQKLLDSVDGLDGQIEIYDTAIEKTLAKLDSQRSRKEAFEASKEQTLQHVGVRQAEIEHMEEILSRYDQAVAEGAELGAYLNEKLREAAEAFDPETWTGPRNDATKEPEYQEKLERQRYLLKVREACKVDVNKIMVSRGEVSEYNVKGRKGV